MLRKIYIRLSGEGKHKIEGSRIGHTFPPHLLLRLCYGYFFSLVVPFFLFPRIVLKIPFLCDFQGQPLKACPCMISGPISRAISTSDSKVQSAGEEK